MSNHQPFGDGAPRDFSEAREGDFAGLAGLPAARRREIALTCDLNYLLPSLVCGAQARHHSPPDVRVRVYVNDLALPTAALARIFEETGVEVRPAPEEALASQRASAAYINAPSGNWVADPLRRNHLSLASLTRLSLAALAGPDVDDILYLDGDMQVVGDLTPLLDERPASGEVLAARDWVAYHVNPGMPGCEREAEALALLNLHGDARQDYINTGMLYAQRETWAEFGPAAMDFYNARPEACRNYDQCAINGVLVGRVRHVSQRFNFLRFYLSLPVAKEVDPVIIHYCYRPKPWDGPMPQWGRAAFLPYKAMYERLSGLNLPWIRRPKWEMAAHHVRAWTYRPYKDRTYRQRLQDYIRAG